MREQKKKKDYVWMRRAIMLVFLDMISIMVSYLAALLLRFDFIFSSIPREYLDGYLWSIPYWVIITVVVFYGMRLYHSIWRFAGIDEAKRIVEAYIILIFLYAAGIFMMDLNMPTSYYFIGYVFSFLLTACLRFGYRLMRSYAGRARAGNASPENQDRVMVIGGGQSGRVLIRELQSSSHLHSKVCCVIDDNPNKKGRVLEGVPIVGNRYDIVDAVKKYDINRIIYAIPATTGKNRKDILNICKDTGCRMQTVPAVYQLVNGEVSVSKLRDVEITSELCRQVAKAEPKKLVIFDIYENNAYAIQQELIRKYGDKLNLDVRIGSVRNTNRIRWMMDTYRPDIVFHAAAHKHVPLMEDSPNEAIKNNVIGTYKTAKAASRAGVKKFVLISTDKAVNPTNIMGASKRLCEMVVQMMNRKCPDTDFVAVRFGNVLGSNGSVIPLFKKQIAEGGPVTVTDKNIIRYFMTIPEAVALVLQASYYAKGGEIFVLDMGDPVKIDDMARNLIRLSGYEPDVDIMVEYTGLRPGEKLFEELLMDEEGLKEIVAGIVPTYKPDLSHR